MASGVRKIPMAHTLDAGEPLSSIFTGIHRAPVTEAYSGTHEYQKENESMAERSGYSSIADFALKTLWLCNPQPV